MDRLLPLRRRPGLGRSRLHPATFHGLRVTPWRGDYQTILVGPRRDRRRPTVNDIRQCQHELARRDVTQVITPALGQFDAEPFYQAGFELHENLHLLARSLGGQTQNPGHPLRFGRSWHVDHVLAVDALSFEEFWRFDRLSLREARHATPSSRFRIAMVDRSVVGYAVTGRAGDRGYLQRLAVAPEVNGLGIGTALIRDGFTWLQRRGAHTVMVNTQERNARALGLYEHLGFVQQEPGLVVLSWKPTGADAP